MNLSLSLHGPLIADALMIRGSQKDFWVVKIRSEEGDDNCLTVFPPNKEGAEAIAAAINAAFCAETAKAQAA